MAERTTREDSGAGLLIVEDDPRIAAVLVKGLGKQGFEAESVTTGSEAIARVEAGGVDLLLLDLGLPDIDGLEVLQVLRERGVAVPVIVITSRTDPRDRATAHELGVREYLTKPFAWVDVWAAVRRCIAAREQA
ncbi:MAG: response regulator transcription factor [Acidimicrobiales bacterium]